MRPSKWYVGALLGICALLAACSNNAGGGPVETTTPGAVPVVIEMQDVASGPSFTVLDFSMQVLSVNLIKQGGSSISIVASPVTVQLSNALTQPVLLGVSSVPAGTYQSIQITFGTASETIQNTGSALTGIDGTPTTCAASAICTISPAVDQATVTLPLGNAGLGQTVVSGGPITFDLDLNVGVSIVATAGNTLLSVNPTITTFEPPASTAATGNVSSFTNIIGQVTAVSSTANTFTITPINSNAPLTIAATMPAGTGGIAGVNGCASTLTNVYSSVSKTCTATFSGFYVGVNGGTSPCATANTLSCVAAGQIVSVNYTLPVANATQATALTTTSSTLITNPVGVTLLNANTTGTTDITNAVQGTVIANGGTTFTMIVTAVSPAAAAATALHGLAVGQEVTVTPSGTAKYGILATGFALPTCTGGATFAAIANVGAGQSVVVDMTSFTVVSPQPDTAAADAIFLVPSNVSGTLVNVGGITSGSSSTNPALNLNVLGTTVSANTISIATGTNPLTVYSVGANPITVATSGTSAGKLTVVASTTALTQGDLTTGLPVRVMGEVFTSCTPATGVASQVAQ